MSTSPYIFKIAAAAVGNRGEIPGRSLYISLSPGNPVQFSVDGGGYFFQADNSEAVLGQLEDRVRGITYFPIFHRIHLHLI